MRAGLKPTEFDEPRADGVRKISGGFVDDAYRLTSLVREGPHAELWRAVDRNGDYVAVKVATSTAGANALRREFRLLSSLEHPSICRARTLRDGARGVALVTEYLAGGDLVSLVGSPPRFWLPAVQQLVDALASLHARGIAHRDVKARHVMSDARSSWKLIDFGSAARFGSPRTRGGTTAEHRRPGKPSGVCSGVDDVYALAVLLYELLAGRLPDSSAGALRPAPLALGGCASSAALSALEELVRGTLDAPREADIESLETFSDSIKSAFVAQSQPA